MNPSEPHWRVNSSFSPPISRRWDCRDGLSLETSGVPLYGSSHSSHSKGSRSGMSSDLYGNHQHSVSDGALSYFESPSSNLQAPRWTPPVQRYDLGEFSTPAGGARFESSLSPQDNERQFNPGVPSMSHTCFSPSPLSESSRWVSSSKQHTHLPSRNFPGRRSFMSTPVYPLVFRNPVSDGESSGIAGGAGTSNRKMILGSSPSWCESTSTSEFKFCKAAPLTDIQKVMVSPVSGASSRREGFRWSNRSSYDSGLNHIEGDDAIDAMEQINFENPSSLATKQECGLCCRLLCQKSPWSSHRIVRSSDLPVTGVLPCGHVFHADCLEETTPRSRVQEPPCPLCLNLLNHSESTSFSEPLLFALRNHRRNRVAGSGSTTSNHAGSSSDQNDRELRRNQSQPSRGGSSSMKSRLRKRLSFKGKMGRDLLGAKLFRRAG